MTGTASENQTQTLNVEEREQRMSSGSGTDGLFYSYAATTAKLFFCILKHDPVTNALQITQRPCNGPCLDLLLINLAVAAAAACGTIVL